MRGRIVAPLLLLLPCLAGRAQDVAGSLPLSAARPLPSGETRLTATWGRPFGSVRLDHGFTRAFDAGLSFDDSFSGFTRAVAHARLLLLESAGLAVSPRVAVAIVLPQARSGYDARAIGRALDGELALAISQALVRSVALFVEIGVLGETDLSAPRTAGFLAAGAGGEWAVVPPLSLVGRIGLLNGVRGTERTFSVGAGLCF